MMDKRLSPIYKNKMDFVDENLSVNAGHLLDVGCGEGHYFSLYKKRNLAFKGIDIDPSMLVNLKKYSVTCADVQKLPFNSSAFDTIVCIDVLEHVKKDKKAIAEICRVLKNNGKLIFSVPNKKYPFFYDPINRFLGLFNLHIPIGMWAWGHHRLYTEEEIKKLLVDAGFKITKYEPRSHFLLALSINYTTYIANYILIPLLKVVGLKNKATFRIKPGLENNSIYKLFNLINKLDKKYFSNFSSINHCFIAKKI
ncbi:methyltransferase domain-containing protein [Candidatus Woesearchaeota archaeon]|nr:methyltransferase domain-containing protein [Candidatus Woesearchaeota archaeon]